jgi:hypothetical protein
VIPPQPGPSIRAVLDRSALLSYARGHVHVGEAIGEITDERDARVGIPAVALLEAHLELAADLDSRLLLRLLAARPTTHLIGIEENAVSAVADIARLTRGDLGQAQAAWATIKFETVCMSARPADVPSIVQREAIIQIPPTDA